MHLPLLSAERALIEEEEAAAGCPFWITTGSGAPRGGPGGLKCREATGDAEWGWAVWEPPAHLHWGPARPNQP